MYFPGAEPLTNAPTPAPTGCDYNNDSDIVARLNEIFGEENCIEMNLNKNNHNKNNIINHWRLHRKVKELEEISINSKYQRPPGQRS